MAAVGIGNDAVSNLNSLPQEIQTYYEKVFLDRAQYELVAKEGGQLRTHPANSGRTVNFTRYQPLTVITSPLGESSNPVTCAITACTVALTLSEYGLTTITSKISSLISIDVGMKEKVSLMGQNMGETLNRLVLNELQNGTSYYPNGHNITSIAAGDVLDACNIRLMVQQLELNKAMPYKDGLFIGKTDPYSKYKLLGATEWVNAHTYSDVKGIYNGEMGELYQVRWLLNKDVLSGTEATSTVASTVNRFYTFVHGDNAFGTYDLEQDQPKLYILPNQVDSQSPAGRISVISWAGTFAAKLLNSNWCLSARFCSA